MIVRLNMRCTFIFLFLINILGLKAQDLDKLEQELNLSLLHLRSSKTNEEMDDRNKEFKKDMLDFLAHKGSFTHQFKHCKTIAVLDSPDKLVRIITWNIEYTDFTYSYDGIVLFNDNRRRKIIAHSLVDVLDPYSEKPDQIVDGSNWYGALYYKMIPFSRRGRTEYILLGWDGATPSSNFKIIDVMTVNRSGVKFGSPVFRENKNILKRVVFEYSELVKMSLRYDDKYKRIIFDHLSPESPSLAGVRSYYVPDMSYDSYTEEEGIWYLSTDIIAVNEGDNKSDKKRWINPSDKNTNSVKHVARMPEDLETDQEKKENFFPKKRRIRKKDNPNYLKVTTGKYKPKRKKKYKTPD